jgi:uncharacterized protein DUF1629
LPGNNNPLDKYMKYYKLLDNIYYPQRWYLGDIVPDDDNWKFIYGHRIDETTLSPNLEVEVYVDGRSMDYTKTEAYGVPVVSERLMKALSFIDTLQFIPVIIKNVKYYVMVVCSLVDCVDESRSDFDRYEENNLVRPDKAGEYKCFYKLKIDAQRVGLNKIFRLKGYDIVIIVSEEIKHLIESASSSDAKFIEV